MVTFATLEPGGIFAGRYRIERRLKAGGMGAVYLVRHVRTQAPLALKVMNPDLIANQVMRDRFVQEAQVASLIDSPHVVQVTDADIDPKTEMPFLVMELLRGHELGELLKQKGRFSAEETVAWLGQAARALDKAHAAQVVHRDLKPANLFLAIEEDLVRVKILDFGIAKIVRAASAHTTQAAGTPLFMAPEQMGRSKQIGPWTDIWAIGLIAYDFLVGRPYWEGETLEELYPEIIGGASERASKRAVRSGVTLPRAFDDWFAQCVHKDPEMRFARAGAAVNALAQALSVDVTATPPPPRVSLVVDPAAPPTMIATPPTVVPEIPGGKTERAPPAFSSTTAPAASDASARVASDSGSIGKKRRTKPPPWVLPVALLAALGLVVVIAVLAKNSNEPSRSPVASDSPPKSSSTSLTQGASALSSSPKQKSKTLAQEVAETNPFVDTGALVAAGILELERHETTRGEYELYLLSLTEPDRPTRRPLREWPGEDVDDGRFDRPVTWVTQPQADGFCHAIAARLPTSAEWSSALGKRKYPWGEGFPPPGPVGANRVVGSKLPRVESYVVDRTPEGVFDLFGSVREWTGDVDGDFAVVRGVALETTNAQAPALFAAPSQKQTSGAVEESADPLLGFRCAR